MPLLIAAACLFGAIALATLRMQQRLADAHDVRETLSATMPGGAPPARQRRDVQGSVVDRVLSPAVGHLGRLARRATPAGFTERLRRDVELAGIAVPWDAERVLACKTIAAAVLPVVALGVTRLAGAPVLRSTVLAVLLGGVGFFVPDMLVTARIRSRREALRAALPDCLDLLSITVEAGLGFDGAVARVGKQVTGPLGEELQRVVKEIQLGRSRADALRGLADRSAAEEVRSFVLAMVQADAFGISISRVLQVQAHEMRVRQRQHAEERAQKVPVKIVFPVLFCIFPALFVVLLGPSAITIWHTMFKL